MWGFQLSSLELREPKAPVCVSGCSPSFPIHGLVSCCSHPAQGVLGSTGEWLSCRAELHPAGFILLGGSTLLFVTSSLTLQQGTSLRCPASFRPPSPFITIFGDFLRLLCAPRSKTSRGQSAQVGSGGTEHVWLGHPKEFGLC